MCIESSPCCINAAPECRIEITPEALERVSTALKALEDALEGNTITIVGGCCLGLTPCSCPEDCPVASLSSDEVVAAPVNVSCTVANCPVCS